MLDVLRQGANLGQPVILFRTSNSDPAEDFTVSFQGTTSDFFAAGLVSSAVALHYGCNGANGGPFVTCAAGVDDPAFEAEYAPYGVDSGLCVGVAPPPSRTRRSPSSRAASRPRPSGSWTSTLRSARHPPTHNAAMGGKTATCR